MARPRLYCSPINEGVAELTDDQVHHAVNVRRLRVGDEVELFDGAGSKALATAKLIEPGKLTVTVTDREFIGPTSGGKIVVASSLPKGERFDWLFGKCTELGVDRICPVLFDRTVKQATGSGVTERWDRLAIAAAKQSGRLYLPEIDAPDPLPEVLAQLCRECTDAMLLVGSLGAAEPVIEFDSAGSDVVAVIGPEGGTTSREDAMLEQYHAKCVRLTETVLRVETAAVAFAAILAAQRQSKTHR